MIKDYHRERKIFVMSLSKAKVREILSKAGVDSEHMQEALTEILDGNIASVDAVKEERDRYKAEADKLPAIQKELDELKSAMANGDKSPYKVKYEAKVEEYDKLKKEYDDYKADIDAKAVAEQKRTAYKQLLKDAGVSDKRIDAVLKVSDVGSIELDAEGKVKDAQTLTNAIKTEWSDFIVTEGKQGAKTPNPPASNGGATFEKMSLADKMAFANENPDNAEVKAWLEK